MQEKYNFAVYAQKNNNVCEIVVTCSGQEKVIMLLKLFYVLALGDAFCFNYTNAEETQPL